MQNILIVGGDKRQIVLKELLEMRGHSVSITGFDKLGIGSDKPCDPACVFLPVPCKDNSGNLKAPFSTVPISLQSVVEKYPRSVYYLGRCDAAAQQIFGDTIRYVDLLQDEAFLEGNARLTAQAAIFAYALHAEAALCDTRCVVIGYGRIGKCLCALLCAHGADVTATARKEKDLAQIRAAQICAVHTRDVAGVLGDADVIWNTVPAHVLGNDELARIRDDAQVIELASPPYGMDMAQAKTMGVSVRIEPGLPGRVFPDSAALEMLHVFEREEQKEWN